MEVEISSSWPTSSGSLACSVGESLESFTLDDLTPDSCVHLSSDGDDDRGEVVLAAAEFLAISEFLIVTDCARWEVVGGIQYLSSVQGDLLDSFEGTNVYSVQLKLQKAHEKLTIRLPPSTRSCWLYSMQVVLTRKENVRIGHFDIKNVNHLLGDEKQLSNKAEKFKSLFENFQSSQNSPSASDLLKSRPKMSDLMMNPLLLQTLMGKPSLPVNTVNSLPVETVNSPSALSDNKSTDFMLLKTYIDKKFEDMEQNIMKVIVEKDKQQNEKLDQILDKLNLVKDYS